MRNTVHGPQFSPPLLHSPELSPLALHMASTNKTFAEVSTLPVVIIVSLTLPTQHSYPLISSVILLSLQCYMQGIKGTVSPQSKKAEWITRTD